jgi:rare lipoprotein A (peptidoglycan hydrolase)
MAGGPALALLHAGAPPSASPPHVLSGALTVSASAPEQPASVDDQAAAPASTVPPSPPTTLAPATYTPLAQRVRATTTVPPTTVARRTTTTLKPKPKPAATPAKPATRPGSSGSGSAAPAPSGRSQSGGATWYDAAPPGTCAHRTLPMGTVVTIRSSSGATATCTVSDRGPYADGMIIDLAKDVFSKLAPMSQGVVQVTISW